MKKIFIIFCCFVGLSAHATEMCARDDTVVISLDATLAPGSALFVSGTEAMFARSFAYGTLVFATGCFSLNDLRQIQGDENITTTTLPHILSTSDEDLIGNSGWYNGDESNPDNERQYCYYQLIHPMLSKWHVNRYNWNFKTAIDCSSGCTNNSNMRVLERQDWRELLFDTIGR